MHFLRQYEIPKEWIYCIYNWVLTFLICRVFSLIATPHCMHWKRPPNLLPPSEPIRWIPLFMTDNLSTAQLVLFHIYNKWVQLDNKFSYYNKDNKTHNRKLWLLNVRLDCSTRLRGKSITIIHVHTTILLLLNLGGIN